MRILWGPEHNGLHMDPARPGAYEWWYFDALSDDGRWAVVAIYFLGTPMSPYYKATVDGANPLPRHWCGIFFSLHENTASPGLPPAWVERAYIYNLYRDEIFGEQGTVSLHDGTGIQPLNRENSSSWRLTTREAGLWHGMVCAEGTFTQIGEPLCLNPVGNEQELHTWVCVAPLCRVEMKVTLINGKEVSFHGHGYHDHNFGQLPWDNLTLWYWGQAEVGRHKAIYYVTDFADATPQECVLLLLDREDREPPQLYYNLHHARSSDPVRNGYGLHYERSLSLAALPDAQPGKTGSSFPTLRVQYLQGGGDFSNGPFYRRAPVTLEAILPEGTVSGTGIGEVFRPSRLCHPLWSWLMWTRIRRRSL
ncbi:MAG: hydroxyneurosporene dehydrogenase [Armatimonadaceae bacterium]